MQLSKITLLMKLKGFTTTPSEPNSVTFMFEGGSYYLDVDPNDNDYVRVGFPSFWSLDSDEQYQRGLLAANNICERLKGVKMYLIGASVYCSVEQFVKHEEAVAHFLPRYLSSLQGAAKAFADEMKKKV